ncbi:MAG: hypothetical protein ACLGHQ_14535 [Acidimicrobiia bacterium]
MVTDEYGFPVEVDDCDPLTDAPPDPHAEVADLPAGPARNGLGAALRAAEQLAQGCHDLDRWTELATATADGLRTVATVVADESGSVPELAAWIGSPGAYTVLGRIVDDAVVRTCAEPGAPDPRPAAGRLAGAIDDLSATLDVVTNLGIAGEFWFQSDQVGHTVELLELGADRVGDIDVVLLGPSTVKRGLDARLLGDATGRPSYNAAVGALAFDLQASWYEALRDLGVAPTTVVVGLNPWIEFEACPEPQRSRVLAADERRTGAFASVGDMAAIEPATRFTGVTEPAGPATYSSALLDNYRANWMAAGGGASTVDDTPAPEVEALQVEQFLAQPLTELCPERLDRTEQLLRRIATDVDELVVVALPTSERMIGLHPDGGTAHDAVVERYRTMTERAGGRFLDRTDAAPDEWFVDLTHLGASGRAELTAELAEQLAPS